MDPDPLLDSFLDVLQKYPCNRAPGPMHWASQEFSWLASRLEVAVVMDRRVSEVFKEEVGLLPVVPFLLFVTTQANLTSLALLYFLSPHPKIMSPDGCTLFSVSATPRKPSDKWIVNSEAELCSYALYSKQLSQCLIHGWQSRNMWMNKWRNEWKFLVGCQVLIPQHISPVLNLGLCRFPFFWGSCGSWMESRLYHIVVPFTS